MLIVFIFMSLIIVGPNNFDGAKRNSAGKY